jgi:hypothetical protein
MGRRGGTGLAMALAAGLVGLSAPVGAQPTSIATLSFRDAPPADAPDRLAPVAADDLRRSLRHRFVDVDPAAVTESLRASRFKLALFEGLTVPVTTTSELEAGASGSQTWSGRIDAAAGGGDATATITTSGVRLNVRWRGSSIDLRPASDGRYLLAEERGTYPREAEETPPGSPVSRAAPAADAVAALQSPVIRVLTLYEDTASAYFGSDAGAVDEITATINELNEAYANSGISPTVESAGIERLSYASSGDSGTELHRLTEEDGYIDEAQDLRESTGADLVMLVTTFGDACGRAWLYNGNSEYGFATVAASCARDNLSYAHELGHNMGAGHGNGDGDGSFPYANGYRDQTNGFRTIMAYDSGGCCPRIRRFSSAAATYLGLPTGSATQDNARVLNETASVVASFRSSPGSPPGPPRSVSVKAGWTKGTTGPLVVSFLAPLPDGAPAITGYRATCTSTNGGTQRLAQRAASPITVPGATTGKRYSCRVSAVNSEGLGTSVGAPSRVVVGAPARPRVVKVVKSAPGSLDVTFKAAANNGAPLTRYRAKCVSPDGGVARTWTAGRKARSIPVAGLTRGRHYRCTVTAKNSRGFGPASAPSNTMKV